MNWALIERTTRALRRANLGTILVIERDAELQQKLKQLVEVTQHLLRKVGK